MKNFLLLFIALLALGTPASRAQSLGITQISTDQGYSMLHSSAGVVPLIYSFDQQGQIYTDNKIDYNDGYDPAAPYEAVIYDENLEPIVEIRYDSGICYKYGQSSYTTSPARLQFYDLGVSTDRSGYLSFTQTLFNDDERYEYIIPVFAENFKVDGSVSYLPCTGFKVVNSDGLTLFEDKFEKDLQLERGDVLYGEVYRLGSRDYLRVEQNYYSIDRKTNSLKSIEMPTALKAFPCITRRNTDVRLDFAASSAERVLSLVDANGRVLKSSRIASGIDTWNVNTGSLTSGLYIVTLSDGATSVETAKIIIR